MAHDLLIRGAQLYDGTGAPPRRADVTLEGDRIAAVGEVGSLRGAREELAAEGLALAPGFIDVHTHDDFAAVVYPEMEFKVRGGVTTCIVGNCGLGAAPYPIAAFQAKAFHPKHTLPEWEGYDGYLAHLDAAPPSLNIGALAGHGTLRLGAMGNEDRDPTAAETKAMEADLREGLEAGVFGLSTGLVYQPGLYSKTDEIAGLAALMRGSGALYATHMRDEGEGLLDSIREALTIGERGGVPVQISHHKASGRTAWGLVNESLPLIEAARARGQQVYADQYPYTAGSTVLAAVTSELAGSGGGIARGLDPADVVIATANDHPEWEGKTIAVLMGVFGLGSADTCERVLEADRGATVILHTIHEDDVRTVMRHPSTMIGSDGLPTPDGRPHPRLYGTFARVLGHYARELGILTLEDAVYRMTGMSAQAFGLTERGVVREGAFADLVLFDPANVIDRGTYEEPNQYPDGISHVFVNGTAVVRDSVHTHARPGRALHRGT